MNKQVLCLLFCAAILPSMMLAQEAPKPTASAKPGSPVAVCGEPHHHLKFANDYVQAYYVDVPPHQETQMHRHPTEYIAYAIGHADIDVIAPDGKTTHVLLDAPAVRYTPCCATHLVKNRVETPFRNITIQLLKNDGHTVCLGTCESDPRSKGWPPMSTGGKVLGYGDTFRMAEMVLAPGEVTNLHTHNTTHLMAAITPVTLKSHADGKPDLEVHKDAGEMLWVEGPLTHTLQNIGKDEARFVTLEIQTAGQ
jgi:quercetin dioxygenase-like cupin family protein